jgi:O-antigen ligase
LFEISILLLAGTAIVVGVLPPRGTRYPFLVLSFIALWGGVQLATGLTTNRFATERSTLQWMTWAAIYYLGVSLLPEKALLTFWRKVIVWFGFAVSVEAILQAYLTPGQAFGLFPTGYHDYVMGPIVYHTHFAVFIETILPIALYLAFSEAKRAYIFLGVSAVLLTAVVVSASRGGLIVVCVEAAVVLVLWRLRKVESGRGLGASVLIFAGVTAVLTLIVGFETVAARFHSDPLMMGRIQFASSTLRMIAVHPFIGWGLGSWPAIYPAFATIDPGVLVNQAHSDWLQWTAEGGVPVGLAMLALAVWAVRPALRSIWGIGVLAVLIHAAFDYPFSRPAIGAWPILILSMVAVKKTAD